MKVEDSSQDSHSRTCPFLYRPNSAAVPLEKIIEIMITIFRKSGRAQSCQI